MFAALAIIYIVSGSIWAVSRLGKWYCLAPGLSATSERVQMSLATEKRMEDGLDLWSGKSTL